MSDNVGYTPGTGATIAADDIGGVLFQRIKPTWGEDGVATDVSPNTPLPVAAYGELIEAIEAMRMAVQSLTRTMGQMQPDTSARMRVALDSISPALSLAQVTTVGSLTTVSTLTNQSLIGGFSATEQIPSLMRLGADSARRNIIVS